MSLFRGREDVYARRWEKNERSGYSPAYDFNWDEFMSHKRRGGSMKDFENKKLLPFTKEVVKKHLLGQHVVGIYPILTDNTSYFIAADFDGETWNQDAKAFLRACEEAGINAYLERSRSGNGGHVWIFFSEPYPCYKSRQIVLELIRHAFHISEFEKEISFDRLFPNQDTLTKNGFGNLIALPLQGRSFEHGNAVFIDTNTDKPFPDQWTFLQDVKRHTIQELGAIHSKLFSTVDKQLQSLPKDGSLPITISNEIILPRAKLTPVIIHFLKDELNFLNTEYLTKRRLGKSTYKVQKYFKLIEESGDTISLPRGFINQFISFLDENRITYQLSEDHALLDEATFNNDIKLTPAQTRVVEQAIEYNQGVIVAPSGSGKTIMGLELIARRKQPALILVHRKQILDQWIDRIQAFLGIAKTHIGQYSGAKKKIGKQITVGLLQSLARKDDLSELRNSFGTIIVDECHHIPASTFREVIAQLNPKYLYGLTATPKRKHNDEKLIYVYIGDIVAQMAVSDVPIHETKVSVYTPEVLIRTTNLEIPFKFTTDHFQLLAKIISCDTGRNRLVVDDILTEVEKNRKILVLSERKEHLEILNMYLKSRCETIVISGDDSARARKSKLAQIQSGHYQVILSTGQFFGEGVDVRGTTCLVLAFPFSFEGKLIQYMGRLRDIGAQKLIIDYRDKNIPFLEKQFKQRARYYKKLKAKITNID
ncbi:DEAD/DEAH box helicase family protein [Candidatus Jorgensenbacteria bacterium]|nr:DEAD/DEAH box helicase family protein [Candidatus Jorgensenbacteria bacterium]